MSVNDEHFKLVSVVIPAYNAETCLSRAIESVQNQTYPATEIIVVNDGSTDNTERVAREFGDSIIYIRQENAGVSVARNRGIAESKGEWIAFLDADDEFLPNKIERIMSIVENNPTIFWATSNLIRILGDKRQESYNPKALESATKQRGFVENYFRDWGKVKGSGTTASTYVVHRDALEEVRGFEPGVTIGQDLDLWWRIAHKHPSMGLCTEPLVHMYLDSYNERSLERRRKTKNGEAGRKLLAKHLILAREAGDISVFVPFASKFLRKRILEMLFHGYHKEVRETLQEFPELLTWYWSLGCYLLTAFPGLTLAVMRNGAYVVERLRLDKGISRRWTLLEK